MDVASRRLANQRLTTAPRRTPADVVKWFGAVQAQEFVPAQWALALRLGDGVTINVTLAAHDAGKLLRTHVLRPTWHFVTPADIRWMLALSAPQLHRAMAPYDARLGLSPKLNARAAALFEKALAGGKALTRAELAEGLARAGIPLKGPPLGHLLLWCEAEGVVVSGPRRGRHHTYALLEERVAPAPPLARDEALGELARRYFQSHGPATIQDFMWWSFLKAADARRAADIVKPREVTAHGRTYLTLGRERPTGKARVFLLPIYDEFTVAYRHREAVPYATTLVKSPRGGYVSFQHSLVVNGQIAGVWRAVAGKKKLSLRVTTLRRLTGSERRAVEQQGRRYGRFLGREVEVVMA